MTRVWFSGPFPPALNLQLGLRLPSMTTTEEGHIHLCHWAKYTQRAARTMNFQRGKWGILSGYSKGLAFKGVPTWCTPKNGGS